MRQYLRREAAVSQRHRVLPDGRLLRDVLRGRAGRRARARPHADLALEGCLGHGRADVRRALSRGRHLHHAAGARRAIASPSASRSRIPRKAKGVVRREVVRVVSPGTLTDASYLDAREPAFLMAIVATGGAGGSRSARFGVALLDLSTGEFSAAEYSGPDGLQALRDEIAVLQPRELVVGTRPATSRADPAGTVAPRSVPITESRRLALRARNRAPDAARAAARGHSRRVRPRAAPGGRVRGRRARCAICATRRRPTSRTCARSGSRRRRIACSSIRRRSRISRSWSPPRAAGKARCCTRSIAR